MSTKQVIDPELSRACRQAFERSRYQRRASESAAVGSIINLQENGLMYNQQNRPEWQTSLNRVQSELARQGFARSAGETFEARMREAARGLYGDGPEVEARVEHFVKGRQGYQDEVVGESAYDYLDRIGALGRVHQYHPTDAEMRESLRIVESRDREAKQSSAIEARMAEAFQGLGLSEAAAKSAARGRGGY